jgi:hypothetical protein
MGAGRRRGRRVRCGLERLQHVCGRKSGRCCIRCYAAEGGYGKSHLRVCRSLEALAGFTLLDFTLVLAQLYLAPRLPATPSPLLVVHLGTCGVAAA